MDILRRRGIRDEQEAADFLSAQPKRTYDPLLLPDLDAAVSALLAAADRGDPICVYGDYDADGVTSTALLISTLGKLTDKVFFYVPSRFTDGYGLNKDAIRRVAERGAKLLITVDCGSTNGPEVEYAKSLGLGVIVTDHHTLEDGKEPDCLFVNTKRKDSRYPFDGLSGCGTVFKLAQGLQRRLSAEGDERFTRSDLNALLDLVAISTVADVVPLLDENRTLVKYGLACVNARKRTGLRILLEELGLADKTIDAEDIGFILGPHINSCGRMETADAAVELLAGLGSEQELREKARFMLDCNRRRRAAQDDTAAICQKAMDDGDCGKLFTIVRAPGAHEGVAGIVAGSLKESLYRPVCIVTPAEGGLLKGTGRCIPGLNLHDMLSEGADLFERYGGHAGACGFSMREENLPALRERMNALMEAQLSARPDILTESIRIEKALDADEKTLQFAAQLKKLEPYGEANPKPLFALQRVRPANVSFMGAGGQHLRFTARGEDRADVSCVLFKRAQAFAPLLTEGCPVDVAGELNINEYNGSRRLQFTVKDIRRSASDDQD
jgi:single-stranded-DNA-specific exonuclease